MSRRTFKSESPPCSEGPFFAIHMLCSSGFIGFAFSCYFIVGGMASPMFGILLYEYVVHIPILVGTLDVCLCLSLILIVHMLLGRCECLEGYSFVAIGDACVTCNMLCIWMQYRAQPHMFVNIITEMVMSCKTSKQMRYKASLLRRHVQTNTSIDTMLCQMVQCG